MSCRVWQIVQFMHVRGRREQAAGGLMVVVRLAAVCWWLLCVGENHQDHARSMRKQLSKRMTLENFLLKKVNKRFSFGTTRLVHGNKAEYICGGFSPSRWQPLTLLSKPTFFLKSFFLSHLLLLIDLGVYNSVADEVGSATETADCKSFSKSIVNAALEGNR